VILYTKDQPHLVGLVMDNKDAWKSLPLRELEKQVSPNLWNPSKNKVEIVDDHIKFIINGSDEARKNLQHKLDIPYGENDAKFDVYGTNLAAHSTIFFWVHGGGWQLNSKESSSFFAENVVREGLMCIIVGYNLAPEASIQAMRSDIRSALKKAMTMYPKSRFIIGGHSAGAHLTSNLLHTNTLELPKEFCYRISGFYLISGVYDMRVLMPTYVNITLQMTPSDSVELSPLLKEAVNPHFIREDLRITLAVGQYESPLFKFQTKAYSKHLHNMKLKPSYYLSPNDDHFSIVEELKNSNSFMSKLLHNIFTNSSKLTLGGKL